MQILSLPVITRATPETLSSPCAAAEGTQIEQGTAEHGCSLPHTWGCGDPPITAPGPAGAAGSYLGRGSVWGSGCRTSTGEARRGPGRAEGRSRLRSGPGEGAEAGDGRQAPQPAAAEASPWSGAARRDAAKGR